MPYFIKVEPTSRNDCGMFSKGYGIHRRGKVVKVEWGPIFIRRGRIRKICWSGPNFPQSKSYKFASLLAAREDYRERVRQRLNWKSYRRLGKGRILKLRKNLLT